MRGRLLETLKIRAPDLPDLAALGVDRLIDARGAIDLERTREWIARLAGLACSDAAFIHDDDLERTAASIDEMIDYAREAVTPGPHSVEVQLSRALRLRDGRDICSVRVRPALFSDGVALGWPPFARMQRTANGTEVLVDWSLLAAWAVRLTGFSSVDVRELPLEDALRLTRAVHDCVDMWESALRAPS